MNYKNKLATFSCLLLASLVASCGGDSTSNTSIYGKSVTIEISYDKEGKVYNPSEITLSESYQTIKTKRYYNTQVLPSTGDINLLVIPVIIPGYEEISLDSVEGDAKDKVKEDIEKVFFAETGDESLGYESVASYYEKSSYGKLHLSGKVTDWYTVSGYDSASSISLNETYEVVRSAVNWAKTTGQIDDISKYDNDQDGYIDGVWLVYSAPDYTNGGPRDDYNNYWAYTAWGNQNTNNNGEAADVNNPVYNLFGWASYDFMYEGYGESKLDAHTFIHETGHFLGLSDYYSDASAYSPIGKVDMMDGNIIDQNSYSKMLLGWTKPYIVTGSGSVTINSMEEENQFIVIPSDNYTFDGTNFDPFGEYILIELYTNDNLNKADSVKKYSDRPLAMNKSGVRIYHCDMRKFYIDKTDTSNMQIVEYTDQVIDSTHRLALPISNQRGSDGYNTYFNLDPNVNLFDEIRLIERNGKDTFTSGGLQKDSSMFKEGDSFSLTSHSTFFNSGKFNNGESFTKTVKIGEIKEL